MVYLKVYEVDFRWRIVEIYIICCVAIVEMILLRLRLDVDRISPFETLSGFTSIEAPVCRAGNSRVLALSSCLDRLIAGRFFEFSHFIKSQFYSLTSMQNVSITKLFKSWITYIRCVFNSKFLPDWQQICCVFNKYLRKYRHPEKNIVIVQKKMLTSA
jgi:hypothetical protein